MLLGNEGRKDRASYSRGRVEVGHFLWELPPQVSNFNSAAGGSHQEPKQVCVYSIIQVQLYRSLEYIFSHEANGEGQIEGRYRYEDPTLPNGPTPTLIPPYLSYLPWSSLHLTYHTIPVLLKGGNKHNQ